MLVRSLSATSHTILNGGRSEKNRKLFTAISRNEVIDSKDCSGMLGECYQDTVANRVAVGIIDVFEVINVEQHKSKIGFIYIDFVLLPLEYVHQMLDDYILPLIHQ